MAGRVADVAPYIVDVSGEFEPVDAFRRLSARAHCAFLDSARLSDVRGQYSFLVADPFQVLDDRADDPLGQLADALRRYPAVTLESLPPFQGGAVGLFSYDLVRSLERIPENRWDEFQIPGMLVGLYDVTLVFDHRKSKAWLVSQGFPELESAARIQRAHDRAEEFLGWLREPAEETLSSFTAATKELASPVYPTEREGIYSNFEGNAYRDAVRRVIEYINAGDAFQVNLAQRLLCRATCDSTDLYVRLRERNPAPFSAYFDLGEHQIVSASPERFLKLSADGKVETRPIKGTRHRSPMPEAELFGAEELKASRKDLSENVMIVDLMRNDLSRVCEDDSIAVSRLCGLERFEFVQHLVSVVEGKLLPDVGPVDLVRATFPGGSITGAPKVRAMEIIAELEPTARGAYCGSLGYIGFDGAMDLSILIRTITASGGWWQFPVGGGIVTQSDPDSEYVETWHKAEGMLRAIL